jgi:hypothetical protein
MTKLTPTRGMAGADTPTPLHDPCQEAQVWPVLWPVVGPPQPQTPPQARESGPNGAAHRCPASATLMSRKVAQERGAG